MKAFSLPLRKLAVLLLAAVFVLLSAGVSAASSEVKSELPGDAARTQSHYQNFSTDFVLTGQGGTDIVAVALAQYLKTGSELGYTEEWCADFVGDCAKLAGQSRAVPLYGGVSGLKTRILNAGGTDVTASPRVGDICFIDWNGTGGYGHVEIVYAVSGSAVFTIGGNSGSAPSLYERFVKKHAPIDPECITCVIRPNYAVHEAQASPLVVWERAVIRDRNEDDAEHSLRFVFEVTMNDTFVRYGSNGNYVCYNGSGEDGSSEITGLSVKLTRTDNGVSQTVDCRNIFSMCALPGERLYGAYFEFTVVLSGVTDRSAAWPFIAEATVLYGDSGAVCASSAEVSYVSIADAS